MENFNAFQIEISNFINDYRLNEMPDTIYHYTTGQALKSIVENQELHISERNYMNDILDEEYVRNIVNELIGNSIDFKGSIIEEKFFEDIPQYIFSTSCENDLIHQWAYYGNNDAYCIEFDTYELKQYFNDAIGNKKDGYFFTGQVLYSEELIYEIIEKIVERYKNKIVDSLSLSQDSVASNQELNLLKRMYKFFYFCIKQEGNYCENEYRFLLQTKRKPLFKIKNGLFVPYLIVKSSQHTIPIKSIIIGPNNNEIISKKSLEIFLKQSGYNIEVNFSKLKTRKT